MEIPNPISLQQLRDCYDTLVFKNNNTTNNYTNKDDFTTCSEIIHSLRLLCSIFITILHTTTTTCHTTATTSSSGSINTMIKNLINYRKRLKQTIRRCYFIEQYWKYNNRHGSTSIEETFRNNNNTDDNVKDDDDDDDDDDETVYTLPISIQTNSNNDTITWTWSCSSSTSSSTNLNNNKTNNKNDNDEDEGSTILMIDRETLIQEEALLWNMALTPIPSIHVSTKKNDSTKQY